MRRPDQALRRIFGSLVHIGAEPGDSEDVRLQKMLLVGRSFMFLTSGAVWDCGSCHEAGVGTALAVAERLHSDVTDFERRILEAEEAVRMASLRGLFLGPERGYLGDARSLLVRARALTHTLSTEALDDALNRGEAMVATAMENLAMKRRGLRDRKIFTGLFFGVTVAFALALWLYAREIRGRWKEGRAASAAEEADAI